MFPFYSLKSFQSEEKFHKRNFYRSLFSSPGIDSGETEDKILGKGHELWSIVYF